MVLPRSIKSRRSIAAALIAAPLLAACATAPTQGGGADVVTKVLIDGFYSRLNTQAQFAGGAPVEVYGDLAQDAEAVADALTLPGWFAPTSFFAAAPGPELRDKNRLVLVFGAPETIDASSACRGAPSSAARQGVVLAAYCDGDKPVSQGRLSSPNLENPRDPAFAASMRGLFRQVLPRRNPERDQRDRCRTVSC